MKIEYLESELKIPFVAHFLWGYVSMYVLFFVPLFAMTERQLPPLGKRLIVGTVASAACFMVLPTQLGWEHTVPDHPVYGPMIQAIQTLDKPHNLVPSLHVIYSALIILAVCRHRGRTAKCFYITWLILICLSTVLVHQHHLLDVVSGLAVAFLLHPCFQNQGTPSCDTQSPQASC